MMTELGKLQNKQMVKCLKLYLAEARKRDEGMLSILEATASASASEANVVTKLRMTLAPRVVRG